MQIPRPIWDSFGKSAFESSDRLAVLENGVVCNEQTPFFDMLDQC